MDNVFNQNFLRIFSVENNVSLVEIFISADEIELLELCKQLKKTLLETESAWKFPKDFIMLCQHNDTDLYNVALDLVCKNPKAKYRNILPDLSDEIFHNLDPRHGLLQKRVSAYPFDSKIIDAKDAALIATWIDNKQGMPYLVYLLKMKQSFGVIVKDRALVHKICGYKMTLHKDLLAV
ncbi:2647_t:CDS:2 [Gigaspora margarita]|uniref:2647_t:CDS:1 n=1 Tax=Gigaspora margarita TaxID=4874 RepID=A0ABN7UCL1_GIGMA|nr:2647_t:CDS:2 [Gigaspora margarita]